jgi:hypothetical protein
MDVRTTDCTANGLTTGQAAQRRQRGDGNAPVSATSRTYTGILRANVLSFFNLVLFSIGAALLALGRYNDALVSVGLGLINAMISAMQEIRATRKLDHLQLLDKAPELVLRDGREVELTPDQVVPDDVLRVRPGDQVVVDGPLLDGALEADESLLTGESEPVAKEPGDDLRSGSLCVAGGGRQLARDVGAHSYAGRLTAGARRSSTDTTPLQRQIAFVVRLIIALVILMSSAILAQAALEGFSLLRTVQITAVLSGLVPYGLFFLIALAYTTGAARIAGRGALVQQVNAVESVSHVDVVCTDKTGTLTTGRLTVKEVEPLAASEPQAALGSFARTATTPNLRQPLRPRFGPHGAGPAHRRPRAPGCRRADRGRRPAGPVRQAVRDPHRPGRGGAPARRARRRSRLHGHGHRSGDRRPGRPGSGAGDRVRTDRPAGGRRPRPARGRSPPPAQRQAGPPRGHPPGQGDPAAPAPVARGPAPAAWDGPRGLRPYLPRPGAHRRRVVRRVGRRLADLRQGRIRRRAGPGRPPTGLGSPSPGAAGEHDRRPARGGG